MKTFLKPWKKLSREPKPSFEGRRLSLGRITENGIVEVGETSPQAPEEPTSNPTTRGDLEGLSNKEEMKKGDGLPELEGIKRKKGTCSPS